MSRPDPTAEPLVNRSPTLWLLTLLVAGLAVAFALYQIWIFFDEAFPHLYHSRTPAALAAVLLGLAGLAVPVWLIFKRQAFRSWSRAEQWRALGVVTLVMLFGYLTPFLLLVDASRSSRAILPYTPTVYLHRYVDQEHPNRLRFAVVGGPGTGKGGTRQRGDRVVTDWSAWLEPEHLSRPAGQDPVVQLRCEVPLGGDSQSLDVTVTTGRTVRFDTRGFGNATVTQDERPVQLPVELATGTHHFAIHPPR